MSGFKAGVMNGKGRSGSNIRLKRVPYDEGGAPAFCVGPPCRAGEGEDQVSRRSQVSDLGLVTDRAQPGLCQQHDVDVVVLNEGGYVGPPPRSADGSCIIRYDISGIVNIITRV